MESEERLLENLAGVMVGKEPGLFFLSLNLTNQCHLRCPSCIARGKSKYEPEEEVSDSDWIRVVKRAMAMNVRKIHIFGGGEALLRPRLVYNLMALIKKKKIGVSLQTNATSFTEKLVKRMVEIGFDSVSISIDGPDPETNDYLRGKEGTFDQIMKNIERFNFWKKKLSSGLPRLEFTPVLSSGNYDKMDKMVILAAGLHVERICLQPLLVRHDSEIGQRLMLTEEQQDEFQRLLKGVIGLAKEKRLSNNFDQFVPEMVEKSCSLGDLIQQDLHDERWDSYSSRFINNLFRAPCFWPWTYLEIDANGTIKVCPNDLMEDNPFTIKKHDLRRIWRGGRYERIRGRLLKAELMPHCQRCCGRGVLETRHLKETLTSFIHSRNN